VVTPVPLVIGLVPVVPARGALFGSAVVEPVAFPRVPSMLCANAAPETKSIEAIVSVLSILFSPFGERYECQAFHQGIVPDRPKLSRLSRKPYGVHGVAGR